MSSRQTTLSENFWWAPLLGLMVLSVSLWHVGSAGFRTNTPAGGELVSNSITPAQAWRIQSDSANVQFDATGIILSLEQPGQAQVKLFQTVDPADDARKKAQMLWVSGRLERLSGREYIADSQRRPRFVMRTFTEERLDPLASVKYATGLSANTLFSRLIQSNPHTDQLEVSWRIREPGTWRLSDLKIESVVIAPRYRLSVNLLALLSVFFAAFMLYRLARYLDARRCLILVTGLSVLMLFIMLAGPVMREVMGVIRHLLQAWLPGQWIISEYTLQKLGHMSIFTFLASRFLAVKHRLKMSTVQVLFLLVGLAGYTEALQRHVLGRHANLSDVAIDSTGIFLGLLLWCLVDRMQSKKRRLSLSAYRSSSV